MKLLQEYTDLSDAEELSLTLRHKGIMTFVSSKESINVSMSRGGASKVGVWVVFPNQYDDAFILLKDKDYKVKHPISLDKMNEIEKQNNLENSHYINKAFTKFITFGFSIILILIVGFVIYNSF